MAIGDPVPPHLLDLCLLSAVMSGEPCKTAILEYDPSGKHVVKFSAEWSSTGSITRLTYEVELSEAGRKELDANTAAGITSKDYLKGIEAILKGEKGDT